MEEIIFVENGRNRKGILVNCKKCGTSFPTRRDQRKIYCSKTCSGLSARNRVNVKCASCGKDFEKAESKLKTSKSGLYFCQRSCKDQAQRLGGIKEIMPPHFGTSEGKDLWKKLVLEEKVCSGCGEDKLFLLSIHHIDGDRNHNTRENLEVVCGNCHIIRHLKEVNGIWVYNTHVLTPRHLLTEIMAI